MAEKELTTEEEKKKYEEMIKDPTKHQLKSMRHARERACIDAMKSSSSKNPHNKGSDLAGLWEYVYNEYYEIQ